MTAKEKNIIITINQDVLNGNIDPKVINTAFGLILSFLLNSELAKKIKEKAPNCQTIMEIATEPEKEGNVVLKITITDRKPVYSISLRVTPTNNVEIIRKTITPI